jgi:hypothetical protein
MAVSDMNAQEPTSASGIVPVPGLAHLAENAAEKMVEDAAVNIEAGLSKQGTTNPEFKAFSAIVTYLLAEMERQPWWKKYSNTVTAAISGVVVFLGWILTTGVGLPHWATITTGAILFLASVLGIHATPDGLTEPTITRILAMPDSPLKQVAPTTTASQ